MENLQFTSPDQWWEFCRYVQRQNRYILSEKWNRFIKTVLFTAKKRKHILVKGGVLYRARIGKDEEEWEEKEGDRRIDSPLSPIKIDAPPSEKAREGRINPKGISYLYLANYTKTAISEVRPWLNESVTVGWFTLNRDLTVVDASLDEHSRYIHSDRKIEEPSEKWEPFVWGDINNSFSTPVSVGEEHTQYVPTQYLSECFKNEGYDGIVYKSSLTKDGHNIVLFDPKVARLRWARLYDIESITYEYKESANPYSWEEELE